MSKKTDTVTTDATENSETIITPETPKFRFDLGITLAVVAIIALLTGIGVWSEQIRNGGSSEQNIASSSTNDASAQIKDIFLQSQHEAKQKGASEIYADTAGNALGVIVYNPSVDADKIVIFDAAKDQYFIDSAIASNGGLFINNLANSLTTLADFNVATDGKGLYTIQPKTGGGACIGVTTKGGVATAVTTVDCKTGEPIADSIMTMFEYGISEEAKKIYEEGMSKGQDIRG